MDKMRKKKLASVATEILDIFSQYDYNTFLLKQDRKEVDELLKYDGEEQDIGCLVGDLKIEFELEGFTLLDYIEPTKTWKQ